jgi:hypothetical protein
MDPHLPPKNPSSEQTSEAHTSPIAASSTPEPATETLPSEPMENGNKSSVTTSPGSKVQAECKDAVPEVGKAIIDAPSRIDMVDSVVPVPEPPATGAKKTRPVRRVAAKTLLSRRNGVNNQNMKRRKLAASTTTSAGEAAPQGNTPGGGITVTVMNVPQNHRPPAAGTIGMQNMDPMAQQQLQQMALFQQQQQIVRQVQQHYWSVNPGMIRNTPLGAGRSPPPGGHLRPNLAAQQSVGAPAAAPAGTAGPTKTAKTPGKKSPKKAVAGGSKKNIKTTGGASMKPAKEIWSGRPDEVIEGGWPDGWIKKTFERQSGKTAGTTDSYWYSPIAKIRLRSMKEVTTFLNLLPQCNGDEHLARRHLTVREPMKNDPKKSAKAG